jgi:hemolysin expression modulating protein
MSELRWQYLMKFRHCSKMETLEKVFERLQMQLCGNELCAMLSASGHRRAEIIHNRLWDKVPMEAWRNVR